MVVTEEWQLKSDLASMGDNRRVASSISIPYHHMYDVNNLQFSAWITVFLCSIIFSIFHVFIPFLLKPSWFSKTYYISCNKNDHMWLLTWTFELWACPYFVYINTEHTALSQCILSDKLSMDYDKLDWLKACFVSRHFVLLREQCSGWF